MRLISDKEFIDFIFSQPKEKEVKMKEHYSKDPCGCLMVQYGRTFTQENFYCGFSFMAIEGSSQDLATLNRSIFEYTSIDKPPKNYGEAQEFLNKQVWAKKLINNL